MLLQPCRGGSMTMQEIRQRPGRPSVTDEAIVPGVSPQVYGLPDFERIAALLRAEAGIVLSDQKRMLAYSRIAPLVRKSGLQTFSEYLDFIADDSAALTRTIASLTTNHTYFNREPHHFEHFAQQVRARLIARAQGGETVRLWSAGCSSGEEIWTLMMTLLGDDRAEGTRIASGKVIALASDLADHAVNAAKTGIYESEALEAMPARLTELWCNPVADAVPPKLAVGETLRRMVRFRQLNLLRPWPFRQQFDVIFCRNVMIYFDQPSKEQLVAALARQLRPDGFLYIGHSERVSGEALSMLEMVGPTIYRRRAQ